jgi:pimeloyl-ACP methyl ester carboxylesterase
VHLPLGLAFVIPALAVGFAWALWKGRVRSRGAWIAVIALQVVLLGGGLVAMNTGEREEDRVERVVPDSAIERHEEYAEQFVWAAGLTLVTALLVPTFRKPAVVHAMAALTVMGTLLVAAAAIRVGHAGGQLVYGHNAGAAYAAAGQQGGEPRAVEAPQHADDDR